MTNPFRLALVWYRLLTGLGDLIRLSRPIDEIFRYYVLQTIQEECVFTYLREPRTYGQILAEFGYFDTDYTRLLFDILTDEKEKTIFKENGVYRINPEFKMPILQNVVGQLPENLRNFNLMAKGMVGYIPKRLRNQPIELSNSFEADGRQLMTKFDKTLSMKAYAGARAANFTFLTSEEQRSLYGKKLLEVGCGSGRETAEIWLKWKGNIRITAVDPVGSMLELAKGNFSDYLDELNPSHPPLADANRPIFEQHGATKLPYPDNSFDAVYCAFVLHWTPDPSRAISEIVRVLKPGGVLFGAQPVKPIANSYFDFVIRANENVHGFFWIEEMKRWFADQDVKIQVVTPMAIYKGHKSVARV